MKELRYVIQDTLGIHARPAGLLVKKLQEYKSDIKVGRPEQMVDAKRIFGVMNLGMKCGEEMVLTFDGPDEDTAALEAEAFLQANL